MASEQLGHPDWRRGLETFATRPLSLVAALILALLICLASLMLLIFPVITGYYYAVRQSKKEEYFIDLYNIFRTTSLVFGGIRRYFVQSYILGLTTLLPATALYAAPVLPWVIAGERGIYASMCLLLPLGWTQVAQRSR